MRDFHLYVILDNRITKQILKSAQDVVSAGADVIQFRFKDLATKQAIRISKQLKSIAHKRKARFIVNDRVDIAFASSADGVHLGQQDLPVRMARNLLGKNKIIGLSCHNRREIISAANEPIDYISIGPVFETPTKPQYHPIGTKLIGEFNRIFKRIPILAIGGITTSNLEIITGIGINRVAVCRAILKSKNIYQTTKKFKRLLTTNIH